MVHISFLSYLLTTDTISLLFPLFINLKKKKKKKKSRAPASILEKQFDQRHMCFFFGPNRQAFLKFPGLQKGCSANKLQGFFNTGILGVIVHKVMRNCKSPGIWPSTIGVIGPVQSLQWKLLIYLSQSLPGPLASYNGQAGTSTWPRRQAKILTAWWSSRHRE